MIAGLYEIFDHWHKEGTVWLYSDPHFGDPKVKQKNPERPSDEDQVRLINQKVGKKDTLIILGDIGDLKYAKQLKGYKVLIAGNHDKGLTAYKEVFNEVYSGALFIGEKIVLSHEPIQIPFALNIHGHIHDKKAKSDKMHINVCADIINFIPINFNQLMKQGPTAKIVDIHRKAINHRVEVNKKRNK